MSRLFTHSVGSVTGCINKFTQCCFQSAHDSNGNFPAAVNYWAHIGVCVNVMQLWKLAQATEDRWICFYQLLNTAGSLTPIISIIFTKCSFLWASLPSIGVEECLVIKNCRCHLVLAVLHVKLAVPSISGVLFYKLQELFEWASADWGLLLSNTCSEVVNLHLLQCPIWTW